MARIDYFFSLMSPFTYLAGLGLEESARRHGAEIVYRPADIAKVFAETGGMPVPQRHPARQSYRLQELARLPAMAGMPLNIHPKHWPVDAVPASLAVIAVAGEAGTNPAAGPLAHAFLRAVWAEERDISDPATIAAILAAEGHDPAAVAAGAEAARAVFDANTALAIEKGVFGAPFYVVGEERFWGQDRLAALDWHLGQIGG